METPAYGGRLLDLVYFFAKLLETRIDRIRISSTGDPFGTGHHRAALAKKKEGNSGSGLNI